MDDKKITRRDFVAAGATGTAALVLAGKAAAATPGGNPSIPPPEMSTRPLGKTGHNVKLFSLGGQATLEQQGTRDESVAIINRAIDLGVNYIDTAASYGRGISQTYIGEVMAARRDEVFLATKTHAYKRDDALKLLEDSLAKLQTDHLDLWQLHHVGATEHLDEIFGPDGAIEALTKAKDEGIVRNLGITGHADPDVLADAISRFDFDCILMALNPSDKHHLPFTEKLLPLANEKNMGVIGMKIPARGRIFREGGITTMQQSMSYVLSLPVSTVIVGCDNIKQLEENISIAANFEPLSTGQKAELEALTADYWDEASFYKRGAAGWGRGQPDDQNTDWMPDF